MIAPAALAAGAGQQPNKAFSTEDVSRMSNQTHLATLEKRHQTKDESECLRRGPSAPAPKVELSEKTKRKAAMRAARLKSSSWYETATRSISIVK